jgi:cell division septum initiation protein DivIVA
MRIDQLGKLRNDLEEMKTKMKQQDEIIEQLRQQLEKKDITPPSPSSPSEIIQTENLDQTVWE